MREIIMIMARIITALAFISLIVSNYAIAQVDRTGTGTGPLDAAKALNTTAVGQTKPPSRAASPTSHISPEKRSAKDKKLDEVEKVICSTCRKD